MLDRGLGEGEGLFVFPEIKYTQSVTKRYKQNYTYVTLFIQMEEIQK